MSGTDEAHTLDAAAQLEILKAKVGRYPEARRRPKSDDELENESRLEAIAEARKDAREAGVSGRECDRRADLEWAERGGW